MCLDGMNAVFTLKDDEACLEDLRYHLLELRGAESRTLLFSVLLCWVARASMSNSRLAKLLHIPCPPQKQPMLALSTCVFVFLTCHHRLPGPL